MRWVLWVALCFFFGCSKKDRAEGITVFAAASLQEPLVEIAKRFRVAHGKQVIFNFAGSQTLARQIIAFPAADIFISANEAWMTAVEKAGRIEPSTRVSFLSNKLVVIAHAQSDLEIISTSEALCALNPTHFSIADPEACPVGLYAKSWMSSITCEASTFYEKNRKKYTYALDASAALSAVGHNSGMTGVVYASDADHSAKVKVIYRVPPEEGPRISYSMAVLPTDNEQAGSFYKLLLSSEARVIFKKHGFREAGIPSP